MKRILISSLLLASLASAAAAQDTTPGISRATRGCFRGAPANRCRWFMITETGLAYRLSDAIEGDERVLFNFDLGVMINRTDNSALGGMGFLGFEGEGRGGLAIRYRRWLSESASLDITGGVHLFGDASAGTLAAPSPTVQVQFMYEDLLGVTTRLDLLRVRGGCTSLPCASSTDFTDQRVYVGGTLGSWGGSAGFAAGIAFVAVLLALFAHSS